MKRLRKYLGPTPVRYFHCGEYGEQFGRPHHHACLFGTDFSDKILWKSKDGVRLYTSETLNRLWGHGFTTLGDVTFDSAAYVARYIVKKITGDQAPAHYGKKLPEYCTMSRGGKQKGSRGLAAEWFDKYSTDLYPKDFTVIRGNRMKIPKYYDKRYELTNPTEYEILKALRKTNAQSNPDNCTARLHAGEKIQKQRAEMLIRGIEKKEN